MKRSSFGTTIVIETASAEGVAERWHRQYSHPESSVARADWQETHAKIVEATPAGPDAVARVIGNPSWTHPICDQHNDRVDGAVVFSNGDAEVVVCLQCLREAVAVLERETAK